MAVIWQVVSRLRRISRGIEDMAETMHRIERRNNSERPEEQSGDGQSSQLRALTRENATCAGKLAISTCGPRPRAVLPAEITC